MEHTALIEAARGLRKRLAKLPPSVSIMAPGLRDVAPLLNTVLVGYEDLLDRVQLIERRLAAMDRIPDAETIRTLVAGA